MPATMMFHQIDPREAILERVKDILDDIKLTGPNVLCAIYERPEQTAGKVWLPDKTREEDLYQGKVMLVLKVGPKAFQDDELTKFTEDERFNPGDWAVCRASDGWRVQLNTMKNPAMSKENIVNCRILKDISLHMKIPHPDMIY